VIGESTICAARAHAAMKVVRMLIGLLLRSDYGE
jgi:hypothetical protein